MKKSMQAIAMLDRADGIRSLADRDDLPQDVN
jgi:hypothetical protein